MIAVVGFLLALTALSADQPPPPAGSPPQVRCTVMPARNPAGTPGPTTTMIVVNDGLPCTIAHWGVPIERRNPATSATITLEPKHGTVQFVSPAIQYRAEAGYVGDDEFAYEATATDAAGTPMTFRMRIRVDVRSERFAPPAVEPPPLRVGVAGIPPPQKTKDVRPAYPAAAQSAGVTGVVVIEATIGPDGHVRDAIVRRSIPELDAAALEAVRQWEFTPTVVNGRAMPVVMTTTVNFSMMPPTPRPAPATPPATPGAPSAATLPSISSLPARAINADFDLGRQALQRRQYEEALKAFRRANDVAGKECADCFYGMALAFEGLGASKNVVESCDRAIALAGGDKTLMIRSRQAKAVALQALAQVKDQKKLAEAEAELRSALALDADAEFLHFNLGVVLMQEQKDTDGIEELKRELALRPRGVYSQQAKRLIENPRRAREAYAPDFSLVTLSREFLELADLHGKVVVLDFWGTWCPPCVKAVPWLRDIQKRHAKDPFVLISVSSDTDEPALRAFLDKNQMVWPQYWDRDRKLQQSFDIRAWPTYVVIDEEGIVRFRTTGNNSAEARLDDEIRRQLKAIATRR